MTTEREEIINESLQFIKKNKGFKIQEEGMSYTSPRISSEFMDCSMPMTFDHYSYCHPTNTIIEMANGQNKKICDVKVGDLVLSYSIKNNKIIVTEIIDCFERTAGTIISIETDDGDILELTEDHPIYVENKGWIKAKNLNINDIVLKITE